MIDTLDSQVEDIYVVDRQLVDRLEIGSRYVVDKQQTDSRWVVLYSTYIYVKIVSRYQIESKYLVNTYLIAIVVDNYIEYRQISDNILV